ncbi:unnamed protein product, partial [Adineta steineri]
VYILDQGWSNSNYFINLNPAFDNLFGDKLLIRCLQQQPRLINYVTFTYYDRYDNILNDFNGRPLVYTSRPNKLGHFIESLPSETNYYYIKVFFNLQSNSGFDPSQLFFHCSQSISSTVIATSTTHPKSKSTTHPKAESTTHPKAKSTAHPKGESTAHSTIHSSTEHSPAHSSTEHSSTHSSTEHSSTEHSSTEHSSTEHSSTHSSTYSSTHSSTEHPSTEHSSTDSSTDLSTDSSTDSPTDSSTDLSTDSPTDSSTDSPTDSSTDSPTDSSTDSPTDSSTDSPTDSSTDSPTDSSTPATKEACFSMDETVTMADNSSRFLRDIQAGDQIWTMSYDGTQVYLSEAMMIPHMEPNLTVLFYTVETMTGHRLSLSAQHYIRVQHFDYLPAEQLTANHSLYVFMKDGTIQSTRIRIINQERKTGVYNLITLDGSLLVNDIAASSYVNNGFGPHHLNHRIFTPIRFGYHLSKYFKFLQNAYSLNEYGETWIVNTFLFYCNILVFIDQVLVPVLVIQLSCCSLTGATRFITGKHEESAVLTFFRYFEETAK